MSISGRERRKLKAVAKVRTVDLKIGKNGFSQNFAEEAKLIINRDGMIKFSHQGSKQERDSTIQIISEDLNITLIEHVGKTMTFVKYP